MINTLKLKSLLVEKGLNNEEVSKRLHISTQSFSMKINNKREFKTSEVLKLSLLLNLSSKDIMYIFFNNNVEFNSTKD